MESFVEEKKRRSLEDLIILAEIDMISDEEITQSITDNIDDGLKLMRLAKMNSAITAFDCAEVITSIASRLSFAAAVLNPNGEEEIKKVMLKIFLFCGTISTSKHFFLDKPELIERIFPFFMTMREWVETLVLHQSDYAVASNLSSSLLADLESFEAILGVPTQNEEETTEDDNFFLL
ncbi:MAG TPA: hypothetical protein EYO73_11400 [Sulfurimonas sp.]|nr:hypothetical protein [Sulfurimonas sp.]